MTWRSRKIILRSHTSGGAAGPTGTVTPVPTPTPTFPPPLNVPKPMLIELPALEGASERQTCISLPSASLLLPRGGPQSAATSSYAAPYQDSLVLAGSAAQA